MILQIQQRRKLALRRVLVTGYQVLKQKCLQPLAWPQSLLRPGALQMRPECLAYGTPEWEASLLSTQ